MSAAGVIRGRIEWDMRQRVAKLGYNTYPLGRWIREVDNSAYMLRCPDCDGRVVAENYLLAVGGYGTRKRSLTGIIVCIKKPVSRGMIVSGGMPTT